MDCFNFRYWVGGNDGAYEEKEMNVQKARSKVYFVFLLKRKVMRNKHWNSIWDMNGFFEYVMRKVIRDAGEFREVQWYNSANDNEMNYEMNFFKDYLRSYFFMKNGLLILLVMALNVIRNFFHGNLGTRILFGF